MSELRKPKPVPKKKVSKPLGRKGCGNNKLVYEIKRIGNNYYEYKIATGERELIGKVIKGKKYMLDKKTGEWVLTSYL